MDWKLFATIFSTVFVAEMGDKTQLSTMMFSANAGNGRLTVFIASAGALVLTSAIGVLAGAVVNTVVSPKALNVVAGVGFIAVGIWTLLKR